MWLDSDLLGVDNSSGLFVGVNGSIFFLFTFWYSLGVDFGYYYKNVSLINSITFGSFDYSNQTGNSGAIATYYKYSFNLKLSINVYNGLTINVGPSWTLGSWMTDSKSHPDWQMEYDHIKERLDGSNGWWQNYEIGFSTRL